MQSSDIIIINPCAVTPRQTENPGCQFFPCLVSTHLRLFYKPANLACLYWREPCWPPRTPSSKAYLHVALSCSYVDCETQGTGGNDHVISCITTSIGSRWALGAFPRLTHSSTT